MANPDDAAYENALLAVTPSLWGEIEQSLSTLPDSVSAIEWRGGEEVSPGVLQMPWVDYGPGVQRLRRQLDGAGILLPFDWTSWGAPVRFPTADSLRSASAADALRYLVAVLRGDRFSEGALAAALQDGRILAILENLSEWRRRDLDRPTRRDPP